MRYIVRVTAKAAGALNPTVEHTLKGDAWMTWDEGDDHWTVVTVGTAVDGDPQVVEVEQARVMVPREHVRSIEVAEAAEDVKAAE